MPIPTPNEGETQETFVSRCMTAMASEFPDNDLRAAVCFDAWRDSKTAMAQAFADHFVEPKPTGAKPNG